jgi:hydrogenase maturation protease
VLGLGNLLLGDDAVGLRLLEALSADPELASDTDFIDGGTQGLALLPYLDGRKAVLVLDAIGLGAGPGFVHTLRGEGIDGFRAHKASTAHEGNALELLATARLLGQEYGEVAIVGIEPANIKTGLGLSLEVEASLPAALKEARSVLQQLRR